MQNKIRFASGDRPKGCGLCVGCVQRLISLTANVPPFLDLSGSYRSAQTFSSISTGASVRAFRRQVTAVGVMMGNAFPLACSKAGGDDLGRLAGPSVAGSYNNDGIIPAALNIALAL